MVFPFSSVAMAVSSILRPRRSIPDITAHAAVRASISRHRCRARLFRFHHRGWPADNGPCARCIEEHTPAALLMDMAYRRSVLATFHERDQSLKNVVQEETEPDAFPFPLLPISSRPSFSRRRRSGQTVCAHSPFSTRFGTHSVGTQRSVRDERSGMNPIPCFRPGAEPGAVPRRDTAPSSRMDVSPVISTYSTAPASHRRLSDA